MKQLRLGKCVHGFTTRQHLHVCTYQSCGSVEEGNQVRSVEHLGNTVILMYIANRPFSQSHLCTVEQLSSFSIQAYHSLSQLSRPGQSARTQGMHTCNYCASVANCCCSNRKESLQLNGLLCCVNIG